MKINFFVWALFGFLAALLFLPAWLKGEVFSPIGLAYQIDPLFQEQKHNFHGRINPLLSDLTYEFYPWRAYATQSFHQGKIPWRNPYIFAGEGQAFVGNDQAAFFFPLNIFSYFFPLWMQMNLVAILKIWLAGFFTYLFLRALKLSVRACVLGGVVFAFSGFFQVWLGFGISSVIMWAPAVLWSVERLLSYLKGGLSARDYWIYSLLLTLFLASQLLAGHLETLFHSLILYIAYTVFRLKKEQVLREWWIFVPSALAAALVGLVQVVSTIKFLVQTALFSGRNLAQAAPSVLVFFKNVLSLATFMSPSFFGSPATQNFYNPFFNYNEQIWYVGFLSLFFITLTLYLWKKQAQVRFWWTAGILALLLALRAPGLDVFSQAPIVRWFDPQRLRWVATLSAAVLAGFGFDALFRGVIEKKAVGKALLLLAVIASLYGVVVLTVRLGLEFFQQSFLFWAQKQFAQVSGTGLVITDAVADPLVRATQAYQAVVGLFTPFNFQIYAPLVWSALGLGLVLLLLRGQVDMRRGQIYLMWVVFIELLFFAIGYYPTAPAGLDYPKNLLIETVQQDRSEFRILGVGNALNPNWSMLYGLADVRGADLTTAEYQNYFVRNAGETRIINLYHLVLSPEQEFLDRMKVKYIFAPRSWQPGFGLSLSLVGEKGQARLWVNNHFRG